MKRNVAVDENYFWSLYLAVLHTANRQETSGRVRKLRHFGNVLKEMLSSSDFFFVSSRINARNSLN